MITRFNDFDRLFPVLNEFRRRMDLVWEDYQDGADAYDTWPRTSFADDGNALVIRAEVPGLTDRDLTLTLHQDVLTLAGERKVTAPEGYQVHRAERGAFRFSRSFSLPAKVDAEKAQAVVKHGVLTLTLPKAEAAQPRQIKVQAA